jgi:putative ABC transport system ATP-binding protein
MGTETTTAGTTSAGGGSIVCSDLVRIYSSDGVEVQALQGLTLRIDDGEMVAIIGASGSGKSTLLGILSGLDKPTAGSATVAGRDLLAMNRAQQLDYRRHAVGFVWQQTSRNLLPYLTVRENIGVPMVLSRAHDRSRRTADLIELLELGDVAERRPSEMSGGQQQRAAIAVGLANSPKVLLADEPTGELDEATSVEVLGALRYANAQLGVTTLIVTHDATVSEHVRRTVQIRDGRTSTEVLRSSADGADVVAERFTVIDSVGRLQLPAEYVTDLGLRDRVRLALETDHVGVYPGQDGADDE